MNPEEDNPNTRIGTCARDLFFKIAGSFHPTHPIHQRTLFTLVPAPFSVKNLAAEVTPTATSEQMQQGIISICNILTELQQTPNVSMETVQRAYSVIACNWLPIHGALGVDGHGRTTLQLYYITLEAARQQDKFNPGDFTQDGKFNFDKGLFTILTQGSFFDGVRLLAAGLQMLYTGTVANNLINPAIINESKERKRANITALKVLYSLTGSVIKNSLRNLHF